MNIEVGKKYVTRDGRVAEVLFIWPEDLGKDFPVCGVLDGKATCWRCDGRFYMHSRDSYDLVAPHEPTFVYVYEGMYGCSVDIGVPHTDLGRKPGDSGTLIGRYEITRDGDQITLTKVEG